MSANKNNKPRNMGNCEMCYYWEQIEVAGKEGIHKSSVWGVCHRFPGGVETRIEYYCGEFVLKSIPLITETERPKTGDSK